MEIVKTKIYLPVYDARLLERRALLEKLEHWRNKKLILLSAAAGSGKTSLINLWLHKMRESGTPCRFAWYSLDKHDNDPVRFTRYLLYSMREAGCFQYNTGLDWISDLQNMPLTEIFSHITNLLIDENSDEPLFIIFDNYQYINSREIHEGIDFFLRYLPANVHIIILSRVDLPLNLSALRVKDQIIDIGSDDLNFSCAESAEFLKRNIETELSKEVIADLYQRTEGWAAGLQLAALFLRNLKDAVPLRLDVENRFIVDYLMEEVYSHLPNSMRWFLLRTSILNRFTEDLCEAVTGNRESSKLLGDLRRDNLFLIPLDQEGKWFRYHHLFSSLLRKRLKVELLEDVQKLHINAAYWYRDNGLLQEAFDHALLSQDPALLNELAEKYAEELWVAGEHALLMERLTQIPEPVLRNHSRLQLYLALLKMNSGKVDEALEDIKTIEGRKDLSDKELGMLETIRAVYGNLIQKPEIIEEHATRAIELLRDYSPMWRSNAVNALGYTYFLCGNLLEAEKCFRIALKEAVFNHNRYIALQAAFHLADVLRDQGRLEEAKALCRKKLRELEEHGYPQSARYGGLYSILGEIACEENDLNTALLFGTKSVELAEQRNNIASLCFAYKNLLRTYFARKEYDDAGIILRKLLDLKDHSFLPSFMEAPIRIWQSFLCLLEGKDEEAVQLLRPAEIKSLQAFNFAEVEEALALARVFLLTGKPDEAAIILNKLKDFLARNHRWSAYLHCIIDYVAYYEQKNFPSKAEKILGEALEKGARNHFLRTFIEAGPLLRPVFARMKVKKCLPDYGIQIMEAMQGDLPGGTGCLKAEQLSEPLSPRELEILKMLPSELGYPEIADKLFISYSTVRTHARSIYLKLGVHSRFEAVNIAKGIGLLQ